MIKKGSQHDRRRHPRAKFDWPVMLRTNKKSLTGNLKNISGSGLAIQTNSFFKINEEVRIALQIIGYDVVISANGIVVRAEVIKPNIHHPVVVRADVLKSDMHNPVIEMGIRFTDIIKDDFRYFTGNVMSEWKAAGDIFKVERKTHLTGKKYFTLPIITLSVVLLFIVFTPSYTNKTKTTKIDSVSKSFKRETVKINLPQKKKELTERKHIDDIKTYEVQNALHAAGYEPGPADGIFGEKTRRALQTYQKNNNLPVTGQIDQNTLMALGIIRPPTEGIAHKPEKYVVSQAQYDSTEDSTDYTLGSGDLITISVLEAKDLNTEVRVSLRGFISLPLLNQVNVQGLTATQAENKIETLLREKYMHDPHVTLSFIRDD